MHDKFSLQFSFRTVLLGCVLQLLPTFVFADVTLTDTQKDQLDEYCIGCHNFDDFSGSLDLTGYLQGDLSKDSETWEKVIRKLRAGMMPPPGQPRPDWTAYTALTEQLENSIDTNA